MANAYLREVDNNTIAFQIPFQLEGKAVSDEPTVDILEDGDLIIEGMASIFDGLDRQGENFTDGAFQRGMKAFLDGPAALCFHHKREKVIGKVLALEETPKGLKMRARVDGAIKDHPELGVIYRQIRKGTLGGLSVGGFFKRKMTAAGRRISDMDFTEISVTPVPVHDRTTFAVVAGKALEDFTAASYGALDRMEHRRLESDLVALQAAVVLAEVDQLRGRNFYGDLI